MNHQLRALIQDDAQIINQHIQS